MLMRMFLGTNMAQIYLEDVRKTQNFHKFNKNYLVLPIILRPMTMIELKLFATMNDVNGWCMLLPVGQTTKVSEYI